MVVDNGVRIECHTECQSHLHIAPDALEVPWPGSTSRPSPAATSEISRVTHNNFPHIPSRRPRKVHLLLFGYLADGLGLPHLTTAFD
jgi:hypothetical protein